MADNIYPRISGRQAQPIDLDVSFFRGGVLTDPYAIRRVDIYKTQPVPHNLVASYPVGDPLGTDYPFPAQREYTAATTGICGTEPTDDSVVNPGRYHFIYDIPADSHAPDVYFDVWCYFPDNPCVGTTGCDLNDPALAGKLICCCHRFWVYPDQWFCSDGLQTLRFGFEPLDQKFYQPEIRPLEIGIMPLPLYDYDFNLNTSVIPFLRGTITIETQSSEVLILDQDMEMGMRQGSYRSNPWVLRSRLDSSALLKGTYRYRVTLHLPDGTSRTSQPFILVIV